MVDVLSSGFISVLDADDGVIVETVLDAAKSHSGLQKVLQEEEEDWGMWGDVEAFRLYDEAKWFAFIPLYESLDDTDQ